MEFLLFTVSGIFIYVTSDAIVKLIEEKKGELLPNRSLIFFAIFLPLALISFQVIQYLMASDSV